MGVVVEGSGERTEGRNFLKGKVRNSGSQYQFAEE